jgi:uncharacterized membrane protein
MNLEHWFNGLIGYCGTAVIASHVMLMSLLDPSGQIIAALVSIIGGLLSGLLSKLLHKYFVDKQTSKMLSSKDCEIQSLQNQIQKLSQNNKT